MARTDSETKTEDRSFVEELKIDENSLDKEWLQHASLFLKWSERAADADREAKKADERVKTVRSEIIMKAANGEYDDLAKPTAQTIEAYYRSHPDYIKAKKRLIDAEHVRDVLMNAVSAFRMRREALENLVRLHLAGYFGAPRDPDFSEDATDRTRQAADAKTKKIAESRKGGK